MSVYCYGEIADPQGKPVPGIRIEAAEQTLSVTRPATAPASILLKYAISYVSPEQAKKNFAAEVASSGFEDLVARGKAEWARVLGRLAVEGGSEAQKRSFYTALYRTHERMVDINEGGRYYSGYDGKVHESARPFYVDDWIWDTYLAQHPLRTILDPGMESDILNSYTLMYEQSGWMPTFPQVHGNHMCMNGYHSSAIFLDGHRKGISGFDMQSAYEGIRKNLTEATLLPWRQGLPKIALDDFFHAKGYYPALRPGQTESEPEVDGFEKRQAVAVTLGVSYDAWVLAQLAKELGKQEDHERFSRVAQNYRTLWHPEQRLFMPKDDQGEWIMINPKLDGGPGYRDYYDENNGWTYAWQVQHDIDGLIELLGGKKATEERLDQLFREPLGLPKSKFYVDGANATGLVGQFAMGNEPAFHIPYLYNYVGAPWKTQKRVRFLLDVWFKDNVFGIPGDEDGGGMSAFVVFSSIGLYPVTPGRPHYAITSPVFEKTTITLPNGKTFAIIAKGASPQRKYIQKAYLNGKALDAPFITHDDVVSGGTLELVLADLPNREWGSKAVVPHDRSDSGPRRCAHARHAHRRPSGGAGGVRGDDRDRARHDGGRPGPLRRGGARAVPARAPGRDADGPAHAGDGRRRGDPGDSPGVPGQPPHRPHDVRRGRRHLSRARGRRPGVPAQGHDLRRDPGGHPGGARRPAPDPGGGGDPPGGAHDRAGPLRT